MVDVQITNQKIPLEQLLAKDVDHSHGAQVVFTGMVRNHNQGKKVLGVSYDAFAPLTLNVFREICAEAQQKWGEDLNLQIWHRTGRLDIGDVSVAIVVSSRHRDESYKASRHVIEQLKNRAPIWKQEHYEDGDSAWLQGHALCSHAPADLEDHLDHGHKHQHDHRLV